MLLPEQKGDIDILVVESDQSYLYLIKRCLDECYHRNFNVDYALSVEDAFQKVTHHRYHLVLADQL